MSIEDHRAWRTGSRRDRPLLEFFDEACQLDPLRSCACATICPDELRPRPSVRATHKSLAGTHILFCVLLCREGRILNVSAAPGRTNRHAIRPEKNILPPEHTRGVL